MPHQTLALRTAVEGFFLSVIFYKPAWKEIPRRVRGTSDHVFFGAFPMTTTSNNTGSPIDFRRFGRLAFVCCMKREEVQILKSQAGFYIGTLSEDMPCSRESNEYYPTQDEALAALRDDTWTQKIAP
jgi:hypothetical protein